jgi:hypothetical protein
VIKEKAANLGLKDITDKDSWIDTKKIINTRLRCPLYCPGPNSKTLVTTPDNQVASCWWEEVLNYYLKPPISDQFVEESQFDGKGFKMIDHINKYFNPSGTVDSLGYIFDLIDIKQASDESVITLKAWLLPFWHLSNWGALQSTQRFRSGSCSGPFSPTTTGWFRTFALVAALCPHPHFNPSSNNARHTAKTPGKGRLAKTANQHGPFQPTQQVPPAMASILTTSSLLACSTFTCLDGTMDAKMAVTNVWYATIHQTSPPIIARIA